MFDRFAVAGRAAWALLGVGAALAVVLWIGWQFRVVFPPLVLAGAIVFILNPVVTALAKRHVPRAAGTGITYVGFVALLVMVGFLIAPLVQTQGEELADQWPEIRADGEKWLNDLSDRSKEDGWLIEVPNVDELKDQFGGTDSAQNEEFDRVVESASDVLNDADEARLAADLDRVAADARAQFPGETGIAEQLNTVREVGTRVFEIGLIFILAPIIAFYLLVDLPHIGVVARRLIPERAKPQVLHVAHRLNHTIGGYFRGQLAVAIIVGAMVSVGLAILGLPFWLIVGMIAGVFNMIPLIGPWVGAVPGVAIALTTRDAGTALWVIAIMTIAQQIDNHFISPLVMQRTTSLHPAVVMLTLLAGGSLGGFFGLLLAVPLAATVKVLVGHLWAVYVLETPIDEVLEAEADLPPPDNTGILEPLEHYVDGDLGDHSSADDDRGSGESAGATSGATDR
ncbi:AI-2E family transporter [Actinospongicola halichondriae]|uniref:AI-2E family transporter n=1 Tax=Actinospongicola halichondriae TaxID=3236844 RepID=UPI003D4DC0C8